MSTLIEFDGVCKYYQMGDTLVKAADHVSFKINKGEFVAIVGQSGSGKSTCMNIIGCLDVPTEGTYLLDGRDVGKMSRRELASIRNEKLGFIFQQYNLLPKLTLLENVEVPLVYAGIPAAQRHATAKAALERVGLGNKLKNLPNQLSGGQQQRVSIARALARGPAVILPTSRPVHWTPTPAAKFWECFKTCTSRAIPSSSSPTTTPLLCRPSASSASKMAASLRRDAHAPEAVVQPNFMMQSRKPERRGRRHDKGDLQAGRPERLEQQSPHLPHHAGHHHRRHGRHRHRRSRQRHDPHDAGLLLRHGQRYSGRQHHDRQHPLSGSERCVQDHQRKARVL